MPDNIIANASSFIELYTDGDARNSNMWSIGVTNGMVQLKDEKANRPFKVYADDIVFCKHGGMESYKPRDRFEDVEDDVVAAQASADAAAAACATEKARAEQAEAAIAADVTAANTARGQLQSTLQAADSAIDTAYKAADAVIDAKVDQEIADRQAAVSAESGARVAAVAAVQQQITNLLDGSAENLQTLAQIASYASNLDSENDTLLSALTADVQQLRAELDVLLGN